MNQVVPAKVNFSKYEKIPQGADDVFELSHSQETLLSCLNPEITNRADYLKVRMRQTLPGFLVGIFRSNHNRPMPIDEIINIISPFQECLRKMDG